MGRVNSGGSDDWSSTDIGSGRSGVSGGGSVDEPPSRHPSARERVGSGSGGTGGVASTFDSKRGRQYRLTKSPMGTSPRTLLG